MAGLFDRPPPQQGLFGALPQMIFNPAGYWGGEAARLLGPPVLGVAEGMAQPFMQAHQAMPWGGNDPSALGLYSDGQQPEFYANGTRPGYEIGAVDTGVAVPWAAEMAGMATTGSLAAPAVQGGVGMGIRAYHGSPHDFDKFSMDKIGTGEGAQAYGHGLYFAENPAVAAEYKKALASGTVLDVVPETVAEQEVISRIKRYSDEYGGVPDAQTVRMDILNDQDRAGDWFSAYDDLLKRAKSGKTYEVDIDASPDEFLDWDKPLSEQPAKVREAIKAAYEKGGTPVSDDFLNASDLTGADAYQSLGRTFAPGSGSKTGSPISGEALRAAGIKGIRYKDAGSRYHPTALPDNPIANEARKWLEQTDGDSAAALKAFNGSNPVERWATTERDEVRRVIEAAGRQATHNYVVFDDKTISILKKYGIAGLTGGGAGAAMLGGSDRAQAAQPPWMTGGRF